MQLSLITLAETLATTGGTFNPWPFIIGAIVLVVVGGAALLFLRKRNTANEAAAASEPQTPRTDDGDSLS